MNRDKLKKEGKKWVQEELITKEQLNKILATYEKKDQSYILILLAALLVSIGILIFAFSDWTEVSPLVRISFLLVPMIALYVIGHHFFQQNKEETERSKHSSVLGVSFIILGYVFFGATLLLIINMYNVTLHSVWPLIIWSVIGLFLYVVYEHRFLFVVGIVINISSQIISGLSFSSFSILIFLIFFVGYFHYAFHRENRLFSYLFAIGLSIQLLVFTMISSQAYYWLICLFLLMYVVGELMPKASLKKALMTISLFSIFIFKMIESFLLQDTYFLRELEIQGLFFVVLGIVWIATLVLKLRHHNQLELIDLLLFIPFFFLPNAYIFIIVSMFIYSLFWLINGFQRQRDDKVQIGIMTFIFSTFTVYIQFAWETLNKSLFFLIGGILLFVLSFILERTRRKKVNEGDDLK